MAVYAHGHSGQWWAEVMGVRYPTVGTMRLTGMHYYQVYSLEGGKSNKLYDQLAEGGKVVLREEIKQANGVYKVIGYVGLYEIGNLVRINGPDDDHKTIEFDLVKKIVTIKNR